MSDLAYNIFKYLHIISAICWLGGGAVLMFVAVMAGRAKDEASQMTAVKITASLATRWFVPFSLATVVFGLVVATIGNRWSEGWVILGLVGFAATFCTGNFLIRPTADAIAAAESAGKRDVALREGGKLLNIGKFDYVMLFTVVFDMVLKPAWGDIWLLAVMALAIIVGAVLFLLPAMSARPAMA